ncbi:MAG TPA: LpxL/LpxP family Kdo(2)-lipid IV(A) lauroyl/palmitoleoyl acyltransferase [Gammaproteobacteria bacterium]|nr:LpxL/LpxP family Kdo(2)-lipid IV(A) lauroyl/palmitoleoyl acyltransferase [Gammaproteobacteria bacterium]
MAQAATDIRLRTAWRFLAPRYWHMWLMLGLLRLAVLLPYGWQLALGRLFGRLSWPFAERRRRLTNYNINLCLPELAEHERQALARRHFEALGIAFFEIGLCWWAAASRLRRLVRVEGLEHLEAARRLGRGVILLSAHFTTLEIGGRLLALFTPFHIMYKPNRNPLLEWIITRRRVAHFERAIPRDDVRLMLKSLKENMPVWYAPDQGYRGKYSAMVPFFGVPAPTNTATSRIARMSGAPVVPFFVERLPGTAGYLLRLMPALENFPSDDPAADAERYNRLIEEHARRVPEQYLWAHNRFKTVEHRRPR